jgi:hypothetical protein
MPRLQTTIARLTGDIRPLEADLAAARALDAGNGADQSIAGAVGADDGDKLALAYFQRNAVERLRVAVVKIEVLPGGSQRFLPEITLEHFGIFRNLVRRAARNQFAVMKHDYMPASAITARMTCSISRIVRPLLIEVEQHPHHLVDFGRPQTRHHFVKQQNRRLRRERARHFEALAVGQRQRGRSLHALWCKSERL